MATIIVDESKDSSKKEQISICVRYVEFKEGAYALHEEFLDFQEANNFPHEIVGADSAPTFKTQFRAK